MVRKRIANSAGGLGACVKPGSFMSGKMTLLEAHLIDVAYDDGTPRQTSTLLIFTEQGAWKACLCARDTEEVCFVTAPTFEELVERLEAGLQMEGLDWRRRSGSKGNRR